MAGLGRRTFAAGEVLTAGNVMGYLQDQAVMNFAGTAARGSAIGTAVSEGMVSYLADTNVVQAYDGSAWNSLAYASAVPTLAQVGLVPIIAPTVNYSGGTATANSLGTITYTGVSSISLNSVFTSAYTSYKIICEHVLSSDTGLMLRLRTSGTDNTSGVYNNHHAFWGTGGSGSNIIQNSTTFGGLFGHRTQRGMYEIIDPQQASRTVATFFGAAENGSGGSEQHTSSVVHKSNTQFDGFTLYPAGGTFTGTLTVFAYQK